MPAAVLERYAALALARALTDEWLADAPLAEIAPPDMLDAEVLRPRDEQWAADAHHALEAYREELGGLTRLAPDSIELAVAGLATRSMNEVVAEVEQRLDSKRTALRESFGAALEVAVRGALGAPAGPLSSAERLVAAWREMLHAKRPVPRRDPVLPSVQTPMSVLSGVVRGLPYPQAALLWAVIAAVLLLYYTIYSPAVPRWWGGDYVSLILGTVLGILVIGALTVVWLRTGRRHVPAAARIVLDASDARTTAHLSRVRDVLAQRALDDLERILARFDGEASPFAAARARLRRLRNNLDQDLMQIALDDGLPRSWLVAAADLAAFWRSNRPDLREESRNFLAGERLGRAVLDGSDGIWWAFREDLLAYCSRWSAQAVAPVSVFRVLRSMKDARRRAIEAFAEYGRPRCSVTPDVNALRLYLVTPDPADPMSQEVARGVKRATDAVAEVATLPAAAPSVLAVLQVMPGQMFSRLPRIEQARRAWQSLDGDLRSGAWQRDGSPWDSWCGNTLLKEPGR